METLRSEVVVVGAGVVGLAVARALARQGLEVIVLERHRRPGEETSSRNSEVIHAGLYYPPDSLKARLCYAGRESLYAYCDARSVPYRRCGKWVVATDSSQEERLHALRQNALANGVRLEPVSAKALADVPALKAVAALASPATGIIDSHALMMALMADLESAGGMVAYGAPVQGAITDDLGHRLEVGGASPCAVRASYVVNAAGLGALPLALAWENLSGGELPRGYFAKGHYFAYSGRHPFERLIYPLPEPGGLGVHLTLDMAGQARFGPDVAWIDEPEYSVSEALRGEFAAAIRRWWPAMEEERLVPAYAGVRPKLHGPGEPTADFMIQDESEHGLPGLVQLFGIESPGLTSCLALADEVVARMLGDRYQSVMGRPLP